MKIDGHEERQAFVASQVKQIQKVWTTGPIQFVFFLSRYFLFSIFVRMRDGVEAECSADDFVKKI